MVSKHTLPSYEKNDPKGWLGNPKYGAALGRSTFFPENPEAFTGKLVLRKIRLNDGGYDRLGTYFGHADSGAHVWWYAAVGDEKVEGCLRALTRKAAREKVLKMYPNARFFR